MPDRLGWICARCGNSLSPDSIDCPACSRQVVITSRQQGDHMVPVDPPELVPRRGEVPGPDRCPECRMPLTMCHDPMCSQPCGRCGERRAKQAEEARLTLYLPPLLARPHYEQMSKVDREWREVFAGLQARTAAETVVEFRLTPEDGQAHD